MLQRKFCRLCGAVTMHRQGRSRLATGEVIRLGAECVGCEARQAAGTGSTPQGECPGPDGRDAACGHLRTKHREDERWPRPVLARRPPSSRVGG